MAGPKIDKLKLHRLLRHGKLQNEIAQLFGVTKGAISKAKKGDHKKFTGKDLCSLNKVAAFGGAIFEPEGDMGMDKGLPSNSETFPMQFRISAGPSTENS